MGLPKLTRQIVKLFRVRGVDRAGQRASEHLQAPHGPRVRQTNIDSGNAISRLTQFSRCRRVALVSGGNAPIELKASQLPTGGPFAFQTGAAVHLRCESAESAVSQHQVICLGRQAPTGIASEKRAYWSWDQIRNGFAVLLVDLSPRCMLFRPVGRARAYWYRNVVNYQSAVVSR